jgi:hypothetical protein
MPVTTEQSAEKSAGCGRYWLLALLVPLALLLAVPLLTGVSGRRPVDLRMGPLGYYSGPIDNDVGSPNGLTFHRRPMDASHDHLVWIGVW